MAILGARSKRRKTRKRYSRSRVVKLLDGYRLPHGYELVRRKRRRRRRRKRG